MSIEAKVAELMAFINDYATARKNVHHADGGTYHTAFVAAKCALEHRLSCALEEAAGMPEGWVMVPLEPTLEMISVMPRQFQIINDVLAMHQYRNNETLSLGETPEQSAAAELYRAMVSARPGVPNDR